MLTFKLMKNPTYAPSGPESKKGGMKSSSNKVGSGKTKEFVLNGLFHYEHLRTPVYLRGLKSIDECVKLSSILPLISIFNEKVDGPHLEFEISINARIVDEMLVSVISRSDSEFEQTKGAIVQDVADKANVMIQETCQNLGEPPSVVYAPKGADKIP